MYTIENRAIPSVVDGAKPVQRKLLYAMLNEHHGKKTKISDLSGISRHGYNHGEASAADAAVKMAQSWSNNVPLFEGHGNFGSRLVPEAAAPRYIYASLSKEFHQYFIDFEVCPKNNDPDNPEPLHYLPIIPWVLVNGIKGIAVGFATNILPRSPVTLVEQCQKYLRGEEIDPVIIPSFPSFRGHVIHVGDNKFKTVGIVESNGSRGYTITELPVGYDREQYIELLCGLVDDQKISDFQDMCSKDGFKFIIKANRSQREVIDKVGMIKTFGLETSFSENLTTLDAQGKLRVFQNTSELIKYFCDYRLKKFDDKIQYDSDACCDRIDFLEDKIKFIQAVIDNTVDFRKTSKKQLLDFIVSNITKADYGQKFISIPLYECTTDLVEQLRDEIVKLRKRLVALSKTTAKKIFTTNLDKVNK
jgi:DNA topoisomerase-2